MLLICIGALFVALAVAVAAAAGAVASAVAAAVVAVVGSCGGGCVCWCCCLRNLPLIPGFGPTSWSSGLLRTGGLSSQSLGTVEAVPAPAP